MARVKVMFDGGNVPVVTGAEPDSPDKPIENPTDVNKPANKFFFAIAGFHTYSIRTDIAFEPLWQTVQAIDGEPQTVTFTKVDP